MASILGAAAAGDGMPAQDPKLGLYSNLDVEEAASKGGKHRVRALPRPTSLGETPEWTDLGLLDAFAVKRLLHANGLHTEQSPHPMWKVLNESTETFVAPKRKYHKKKKTAEAPKRAERLRRQREAALREEEEEEPQEEVHGEGGTEKPKAAKPAESEPQNKRLKKKRKSEHKDKEAKHEKKATKKEEEEEGGEEEEEAPAPAPAPPAAAAENDEEGPPQKKQRTEFKRPKKNPVEESRFRVLSRRTNAKNKKKKKNPNISGQICTLEVQQVVSKGKTGNTPKKIGDLRWSGMAGRHIPKQFPAVNVSVLHPPCTISHHGTGELGLTGSQSEHAALVSMWMYERKCAEKSLAPLRPSAFRAVNFTTRGNLGSQLDLETVKREFDSLKGFSVSYDPENISSVQIKPFRLTDNKKTRSTTSKWAANVFDSGLICVVGFSSRADIEECKNKFFPALKLVLMAMEQDRMEKESNAAESSQT